MNRKKLAPIGRCLPAALACVAGLAPLPAGAAPLRHDAYLCVSVTKGVVIGSRGPMRSGLYRSTDRVQIEHVGFHHIRLDSLAADPRDPRTLFVAGLNGVLRTTDSGRTWRIMTGWDMTEPKDITIDPHAPDDIYIGLPDGIGVSRDRGQTWRRMDEGIRRKYTQSILVDRTAAGRVLAGTELGIFLSEDAARTWQLVLPAHATVNDIRQSPHQPAWFVAVTQSDGAAQSTDGGRTWQPLAGVPADHTLHNVAFDPTDRRRLALCGWGVGVLVSEDGGATWTPRNEGLPNEEVWDVAIDPDRPGCLYASPHLEAVFVSDDFGRTWRNAWFEGATVWDVVFVPRVDFNFSAP